MNSFEYLSVFIAVIMGLAVTRLLSGIGASLRHRKSIEGHWVHSLWALNILVYVISIWWALFAWNQLPDWNYFLFLFIVSYAIVLYLLSDALYPDRIRPGLDLKTHFIEHRGLFFGLLFIATVLDIPETVLKDVAGLRPVPVSYWVLHLVWFVVPPIGFLTTNPKVHGVLPAAWFLATVIYVGWGLLALAG